MFDPDDLIGRTVTGRIKDGKLTGIHFSEAPGRPEEKSVPPFFGTFDFAPIEQSILEHIAHGTGVPLDELLQEPEYADREESVIPMTRLPDGTWVRSEED